MIININRVLLCVCVYIHKYMNMYLFQKKLYSTMFNDTTQQKTQCPFKALKIKLHRIVSVIKHV